MPDIVVIGAGLSGLTAAGELHRQGYDVLVVDKSRGLGGRLATRRVGITVIDHGCRYLQPFTQSELDPIPSLLSSEVLQPWQPDRFVLAADGSLLADNLDEPQPLYVAPQGMSAIAKALAPGLTIQRHWRATALAPISHGWRITGEVLGDPPQVPSTLEAKAVVMAIPAAQAIALLEPASQTTPDLLPLIHRLQTVTFDAVITVMAGYGPDVAPYLANQPQPTPWLVASDTYSELRWIALDSSKRPAQPESVVVLHSSAAFAAEHLHGADLDGIAQHLLQTAAPSLGDWIAAPSRVQIHRWRYGFVQKPLGQPVLSDPQVPTLVGCGDWCNGGNVEGAIASGHQAAVAIAQALG